MKSTSKPNTSLTPIQMIQQTELELADSFDLVCRKHSLRYSLAFGSFIGAVRHKGFIPWDDDIDVIMPRKDYDEFFRIARDELPDYFEVQHFKFGNSKRYVSRIVDTRTLMHLSSYEKDNDIGIWLDIFVLDGLPDKGIEREFCYFEVLWRKACVSFAAFDQTVNLHRPGRPKFQQLIINFCAATKFGHLWSLKKNLSKYDRVLKRIDTFANHDCFCGAGTYDPRRQTWPADIFLDLVDYEFEGHRYLGVKNFDAILRVTYGDYMALPSENNRVVHQIGLVRHPLLEKERYVK